MFEICHELTPQPEDVIIKKQRASIFQGTPIVSHLNFLGVKSLIVCGESTSGCVRASCVDAYSFGYHVSLVDECTYDRSALIHKLNLFDLAHKYVDVMKVAKVVAHLDKSAQDKPLAAKQETIISLVYSASCRASRCPALQARGSPAGVLLRGGCHLPHDAGRAIC